MTVGGWPSWVVLLIAAGAVVAGLATSRELATAGYRIPEDEADHDPPRSWWVVPLLVALALWATRSVGDAGAYAALPAYLLFAWLSVCLVWIDLDVHRLPVGLTRPALPAALLLLVPPSIATGEWGRLLTAVLCAVVLFVGYAVLAFLPGGGFGGGDVQLAPLIGLLLGWLSVGHVVVGTMAAFVLGGIGATVLLLTGRAGRSSAMAFGPFMCAGVFVALDWTDAVLAGMLGT
ncbi:leader peptidase (prepilin peptidase)/N-methyltransferase [Knoellia remsis]|uniref:Leader peptidase (Prepilin peptidase)/N-methyltransferase n=1 Tax=Knoellia remsis TaxID=407159 RepID=A0A2T0UU60_9MICO|nr:prepilin peptidase [Knoellia remsis]PRY61450.1 leader peptidase (prepilin peptidase)/N-methyltransferase [Knoellia remsis]